MEGNGHRPKPAGNGADKKEKPQGEGGDKRKSRVVRIEPNERGALRRQSSREVRRARQGEDRKIGTDLIAAVIVILAFVLCTLIAYYLWVFALSRPSRNPNYTTNIILPR